MSDPWSVARLIAELQKLPQDARVKLTTFAGPGSPQGEPHDIRDVYSMSPDVWLTCDVPAKPITAETHFVSERPLTYEDIRHAMRDVLHEAVLTVRLAPPPLGGDTLEIPRHPAEDPGPEHRLLAGEEVIRSGDDAWCGGWEPVATRTGIDLAGLSANQWTYVRRRVRPALKPGVRWMDHGEAVSLCLQHPAHPASGLTVVHESDGCCTAWPADPRFSLT